MRAVNNGGNHRRLGGKKTPQEAYSYGYRFAIVAPKGHIISFHMTEERVRQGLDSLRTLGCRSVPLESLL